MEGDVELVSAVVNANKHAYPSIAAAIDADLMRDAALALKFRDNEAGRKAVQDEQDAAQMVEAMHNDLLGACGGPGDEIAALAQAA